MPYGDEHVTVPPLPATAWKYGVKKAYMFVEAVSVKVVRIDVGSPELPHANVS